MELIEKIKTKKPLKIGVIVLVAILVIVGISNLFGGASAKAEKAVENLLYEEFTDVDSIKVKTKTVAKNKENKLYAVDTTVTIKDDGDKITQNRFVIVHIEKNNNYTLNAYQYDKSNRKEVLELVYSALVRG